MLHIPRFKFHERWGQATISLVFLIGGLVIMVAVSLAFLILSFINSGYGFRAANQALSAANGGVSDALMILARNKDYSGSYSLPVGSYAANVTVSSNPAIGQTTITSLASASRYQRKVQAIVAVNSSTGQTDLLSWTQIML